MEGHTWIYVIAILIYLYYLSKILDKKRELLIAQNRLQQGFNKNLEDENGRQQKRQIKREKSSFRKRSLLYFLGIPVAEVISHLIVGSYELNGQLLSLSFFILFLLCLLLILFVFQSQKEEMEAKKYTRTPDVLSD